MKHAVYTIDTGAVIGVESYNVMGRHQVQDARVMPPIADVGKTVEVVLKSDFDKLLAELELAKAEYILKRLG